MLYPSIEAKRALEAHKEKERNAVPTKPQAPEAPGQVKTAHDFCMRASALMGQRGKEYDKQQENERSMQRCVTAFNAITGHQLTEAEGYLLLQVLKDVRQWQHPGRVHHDSIEDCVAYAALKAEALVTEEARQEALRASSAARRETP